MLPRLQDLFAWAVLWSVVSQQLAFYLLRFILFKQDELDGTGLNGKRLCYYMGVLSAGIGYVNFAHLTLACAIAYFVWPLSGNQSQRPAWEHLQRFAWAESQVQVNRKERSNNSVDPVRMDQVRCTPV